MVLTPDTVDNTPNAQPNPNTHAIEPELRQPLPRTVRIDPSYALRQMRRLVVMTVATSLLWTVMGQLADHVDIAYPQTHSLGTNPNDFEAILHNYRGLLSLITAILIGCLALLWFSVFIETGRRYQLVVSGGAAHGRIQSKRIALGRDGSFTQIYYRFTAPDGARIEGRTDCSLTDWRNAKADDQITILFAPDHPANNVLYLYGGFKAA